MLSAILRSPSTKKIISIKRQWSTRAASGEIYQRWRRKSRSVNKLQQPTGYSLLSQPARRAYDIETQRTMFPSQIARIYNVSKERGKRFLGEERKYAQ